MKETGAQPAGLHRCLLDERTDDAATALAVDTPVVEGVPLKQWVGVFGLVVSLFGLIQVSEHGAGALVDPLHLPEVDLALDQVTLAVDLRQIIPCNGLLPSGHPFAVQLPLLPEVIKSVPPALCGAALVFVECAETFTLRERQRFWLERLGGRCFEFASLPGFSLADAAPAE